VKLTARIATTFGTSGASQKDNGRAAMRSASRVAEGNGARSGRHPLALMATLFASVALMLGVVAPAASAATPIDSYGYLATFGDGGGIFFNPQFNAVAVDGSTGNILVAETVDPTGLYGAAQIYSPDSAAGGMPLVSAELSSLPFDVAVDQLDGSMYILTDTGIVQRYLSDGAPVPTYTLDPSFASAPGILSSLPAGIAVDPVTHDVLVGDRESKHVYRLDATGALVSSFDGSNTADGAFSAVGALAVGPTGMAYVVDGESARVERFNAAGASLGKLPLRADGGPSSIAVNPETGEVAVLVSFNGQTFIEGFTAGGEPAFSSRVPVQAYGSPIGLAWAADTDRLYMDVNTGTTGTVHTFVPATQPALDTPVVSQITGTSAHITAKVAPGGEAGEKAKARIEYCPATANCAAYVISEPGSETNPWVRLSEHEELQNELDGSGEVTIEDELAELDPNSEYLVRASADRESAKGVPTDNTSASTSFETPLIPPVVETGPAGAITDTQAELTGTIATYGDQTLYRFEYGLTTSYGSSVPASAEGVAGNERATRTFSRLTTGLQSETTYHYRLVAHNAAGEAVGVDRTFTTAATAQLPPDRGYEQVSPVDKRGATLNTFGFQTAADGSAIEYIVAAAGSDATGAPLTPRYLSRRGTSGWQDWQPLDPPQNVSRGIILSATQAVSPDFTHALVVSNRALAPGAIENGGNLYVVDLQTGAYSLVGASDEPDGRSAYAAMTEAANMYVAGAPDFSWVVVDSRVPLLPGVSGAAMYKWTPTGGLEVESRLPGPNKGSIPSGDVSLQGKGVLSTRQVSDDGNTMYFTLTTGATDEPGVYRRENGQTTAISVSQIPGDPTTPLPGMLMGVSRDGRYSIFASGRLTADAVPVNSAFAPADLYQYDLLTGDLTFISKINSLQQAAVMGVSDDGQTVYFNDDANTVVWRNGMKHTVTNQTPNNTFEGMQAFPSPNGRYMAYVGEPSNESADGNVYLYDADTDQTVCISCRSDGSRTDDARVAPGDRNIGNRAPQVVTDNGMAFFDTAAPLISADHNGVRDVYAYQNGVRTLISAGDGNFPSRFADASADGSTVFFTTDEQLVGQDIDESKDVYASRIGGGFPSQSPPAPPAPCIRSECGEADSGTLSSPPFSSSLSQAPDKPKKHCRKGTHPRKVAGKIRCVKPSKGRKKTKRANTNRRQGR